MMDGTSRLFAPRSSPSPSDRPVAEPAQCYWANHRQFRPLKLAGAVSTKGSAADSCAF